MMLYWAAVFFLTSLICAVLGFAGVAGGGAAAIAKVLFFIFLVAFVVTLLMGVFNRPPRN